MSSKDRRKITLYLHPTDAVCDCQALKVTEEIPSRLRGEFFRHALIAGISLSKVDKRLPALIAMLFDGSMNAEDLSRTLSLINPNFDTLTSKLSDSPIKNFTTAVAWQRRNRNTLNKNTSWGEWFTISENEYDALKINHDQNLQVRALYSGDIYGGNDSLEGENDTAKIERKKLAEKAKMMFNG